MNSFWESLDALVRGKEIVIDRPKGSAHPRYSDYIYPYDYGYLEDTTSMDGGGIDVWLGSGDRKTATGIVTTFDALKSDIENKLLLGCSPAEMQEILACHTHGGMTAHLVIREKQ